MRDIMAWNECKEDFIKEVDVDNDKIESLIETANRRLKFLSKNKVNKENVSFIIEGYYEVIKELLTAFLLSKGLRSKNHQCLISYFYNHCHEYEAEAYIISQMNYLRNRLEYYGELISIEFYEKNKYEFKHIIKLLNDLIK